MKRLFLLIVLLSSVFVVSGCVDTTVENSGTKIELTEEHNQLNTLLQNLETLINEQNNYTLTTTIQIRYYEDQDSLTYTENIFNKKEKFDLEHNAYESEFQQKVGYQDIEVGQDAYRIVDNYKVSFQMFEQLTKVNQVTPYGGNYTNDALLNLKLLMKNIDQSVVHKDNDAKYTVYQNISSMIEKDKQEKLNQLGFNNSELNQSMQFYFIFNTETNELKISINEYNFKYNEIYNYALLNYTMTFHHIGDTVINSSIIDYNGDVGTSTESVIFYSDAENLFTIPHTNYQFYKIIVDKPSIYQLEWVSGHTRPFIDNEDSDFTSFKRYEWISDEAIYFEPGAYVIMVNDPFRLKKEAYSRHRDYTINYTQSFTFNPNGAFDFSRLAMHTDPYNTREYIKIKLSDNGELFSSLSDLYRYKVTKGSDGYYYTNSDLFFLKSLDGNQVTVDVSYEEIHQKDQAPIITNTYDDYFYSNNKYKGINTYHALKISQTSDYMISFNYLDQYPNAKLIITDQYGTVLFERDNHPIVHLDEGLYYVYLDTEETCFYQVKYIDISNQ